MKKQTDQNSSTPEKRRISPKHALRQNCAETAQADPRAVNWTAIGDLICSILSFMREHEEELAWQAAQRGISVEQFNAAAITTAVRAQIEGPQ